MRSRWSKPLLFLLCTLPFWALVYNGATNNLTANPIKEITHFTGEWALHFLLITLAITPLRRLTGNNSLIRFRRMLGLFAFFYACLHFCTYLVLDQFFDWHEIVQDVAKRPYITVGFSAFVLLIPLALTSTNKMVQRLGRNWRRLHSLIYPIAILVICHYLWLVKADILPPLLYGLVLCLLLALRTPWLKPSLLRQKQA
ncbi:MAG: sulfoxide reductase heme-binding subunit YedZ [Gammaproteobacteria bacterium]|nr:sulfoxide reductase heme-binding subunit YedZ [Gammaproteobacteria bacterium]MCY4211010.1 sulfoxide reductase heme-binding subunit YedZ [Gammaproteobacteria bacterium]MCY4281689.1 sulfoxide reductase heme-binding subunit YedZ [Gammaproteobacteria bacterium]MCY4337647.1 sulfoxide reductase heme-binding subunit YedZ [Gammaproteobacteria bacterium]